MLMYEMHRVVLMSKRNRRRLPGSESRIGRKHYRMSCWVNLERHKTGIQSGEHGFVYAFLNIEQRRETAKVLTQWLRRNTL